MEIRGVMFGAVLGYLWGKRQQPPSDGSSCPECPVCVKPTPCPVASPEPAPSKTPPAPQVPFVQVTAAPVQLTRTVAPVNAAKKASPTLQTPQISRSSAGKVIAMVRDLNELRAFAVAPIAARGAVPRELDPWARWGTTAGGPLPVSGTLTPQVRAAETVALELAMRSGFRTVAAAVQTARTSAAARERIARAWMEIVTPAVFGSSAR